MSDVGSWNASLGSTAWHPAKRVTQASRRRPMPVPRGTQLEIRTLEERLANPGPGETSGSLGAIVADDFREFGSSGRIFDAAAVLGTLAPAEQRGSRAAIGMEGFRVERVAPNVVLATYLARRVDASRATPPSLRTSLWCKRDGRWQIVFHQGTTLAEPR